MPDTISVVMKPVGAAMIGKNISGAAATPSAGNSWKTEAVRQTEPHENRVLHRTPRVIA